jgi:hypothetical protein
MPPQPGENNSLGGDVGNSQSTRPVTRSWPPYERNQVVTIDPQSDQVTGRYDTPAIIRTVCRFHPIVDWRSSPAKEREADLQSMAVTQSCWLGADVLAFDGPRRVLYVAAKTDR